MRRKLKTTYEQHADFLRMGYYGLVLRGYNNEREIPDPILRKVWRLGKRAHIVAGGTPVHGDEK